MCSLNKLENKIIFDFVVFPFSRLLKNVLLITNTSFIPVVAPSIARESYLHIDLSQTAKELASVDLTAPEDLAAYIDGYCRRRNALIAYGGYLEIRNLYQRSAHFNQQDPSTERNIHLGVDFWAAAGTPVVAPIAGKMHSFQDNKGLGDYGPTIILEHEQNGTHFYTLYGHLNRAALKYLAKGQTVAAGTTIAALGTAAVNGEYAPHLHFQVIRDLQGKAGDYPGVCNGLDLDFYQQNCPDPKLLLGL
jgi:murein DD-endopeptidase MepM/ murein hydrolase activator NlpD